MVGSGGIEPVRQLEMTLRAAERFAPRVGLHTPEGYQFGVVVNTRGIPVPASEVRVGGDYLARVKGGYVPLIVQNDGSIHRLGLSEPSELNVAAARLSVFGRYGTKVR